MRAYREGERSYKEGAERRDAWVRRFFEQRESHGLNVKEFAIEAGITAGEFWQWYRVFGQKYSDGSKRHTARIA